MELQYRSTAYVWFDTEYSGLELETAHLLQVAAIVTDADLQRIFPREQDLKLYVKLPAAAPVSPWIQENMPDVLRICRSELAMDVAEVDGRLAELVQRICAFCCGVSDQCIGSARTRCLSRPWHHWL